MRPDFQQTDFTYVMGGPLLGAQNWPVLASVPPGAQFTKLPLRLDTDAPFLLRSIAARVQYDPATPPASAQAFTHRQTNLNFLQFRFTGPTAQYLQQVPVPILLQTPFAGQCGNPMPLQRQVYYPAGGLIQVDLLSTAPTQTLTNVTLYFRGVKLWPWGVRRYYPFPRQISVSPYAYSFGESPPEFPTLYQIPVTQAAGTPIRRLLNFDKDGDFVLRTIQAGPSPNANFSWEVFFRLRDSDEYPYSNDFVHADVMCGNSTGPAAFPTGSGLSGPAGGFLQAFQVGPALPGLIFPEVYLPNHQFMWLDIARSDAAFVGVGAVAQDFPVALQGVKVFQVS